MKIKLSLNYGFFEEKEPVIISDAPITFSIEAPHTGEFFAIAQIGNITRTLSIKDNAFELPDEMKIPGELHLTIVSVVKDQICKRWRVEALILIELDDKWEAIPEIVALNGKIAEQSKQLTEIKKALVELKNIVTNDDIM